MREVLLATKLHIPHSIAELVNRPRLTTALAQGLHSTLTLVSAPAGFGKTTLVAAHLNNLRKPAAWLALDEADNQPVRFLRYLVAALQQPDASIGQEAMSLLTGPGPPQGLAGLTDVINDLARCGREVILALDDYHLISSQAVHDALGYLLEHCPQNFHLILVTRSDPPLPLAGMRARGQLRELRAADLRFTAVEASMFLNQVMGLQLDDASVTVLEERTEGWIAGLQMAALSMRDREDVPAFIAGFSGSNRYILDYLLEEVLDQQPLHLRRFLLHTSILERLSAPLCEAVLAASGEPEGSAVSMLEKLERENLFLLPVDEPREWYRYHQLFADLLQARLQREFPEQVASLHASAAGWLTQHGFLNEAVQHYLAAGESSHAAALIADHGALCLSENDPSLLQLAALLPIPELLERPRLALHHAWQLITFGRIEEARRLLQPLYNHLLSLPDADQRWMLHTAILAQMFLSPEAEFAVDPTAVQEPLAGLPDTEPVLKNAAEYLYVMTLARRGQMERAAGAACRFLELEQNKARLEKVPTLAPFLSRIYLMLGMLHKTAALCHQYLDPLAGENRFVYAAGNMKIDLGEVLYEWNRIEEAERYIREGLQANRLWGNIMTEGFGLVALVQVLLARGAFREAREAVAELEALMKSPGRRHEFVEDLQTLRVRVQLAGGDLTAAAAWAETREYSRQGRDGDLSRATIARIRLAQGDFAAVEKLLAGKTPPEPVGSRTARQLQWDLLRAAAAAGQGKPKVACALLKACLELAAPEGYVRVFLEGGEAVENLLRSCVRSGKISEPAFANMILEEFTRLRKIEQPARQELVEPLSDRELEVLRIMAEGKTNREIAERLVIAPGTVKAHTSSIYRKLEAANRTEAVAHARDLSLLP